MKYLRTYLRTHKLVDINESAWYDDVNNVDDSSVKQEIKNILNSVKGTIDASVSIFISEKLDYKLFNHIGGQLVESKVRRILNLDNINNPKKAVNKSESILDGEYIAKCDNKKYYVEIKAFMNNISSINTLFNGEELKKIKDTYDNVIIIICKYSLNKNRVDRTIIYDITDFYVLTKIDFLNNLNILNKKRKEAVQKKVQKKEQNQNSEKNSQEL